MMKRMTRWMLVAFLMMASSARAESVVNFEYYFGSFGGTNLSQVATQLYNSCGPMADLIVNHYYDTAWDGIPPSYVDNTSEVAAAIGRLYTWLGKTNNTYTVPADLYNIFANKWSYGFVEDKDDADYPTFADAYAALRANLGAGRPVIVLTAGYIFSPTYGAPHYVVIHSADDNEVKYADPWDGTLKTKSKANLQNDWMWYSAVAASYQ